METLRFSVRAAVTLLATFEEAMGYRADDPAAPVNDIEQVRADLATIVDSVLRGQVRHPHLDLYVDDLIARAVRGARVLPCSTPGRSVRVRGSTVEETFMKDDDQS